MLSTKPGVTLSFPRARSPAVYCSPSLGDSNDHTNDTFAAAGRNTPPGHSCHSPSTAPLSSQLGAACLPACSTRAIAHHTKMPCVMTPSQVRLACTQDERIPSLPSHPATTASTRAAPGITELPPHQSPEYHSTSTPLDGRETTSTPTDFAASELPRRERPHRQPGHPPTPMHAKSAANT